MRLLIFLLLMTVSALCWSEDGRVMQLEKALIRVQQEAQAVHQQFLMIQELRRHEISGPEVADLPGAAAQTTPIPKYEEMLRRQQNKKERIEKYTVELDRLYSKFSGLNEERQALIEQIELLEKTSAE
ncbi:MAG: hypothetical protein IT525_03160 [Nitrosomonas sp.]|nr:hypothetical protein [Nitrosomonas sp.]